MPALAFSPTPAMTRPTQARGPAPARAPEAPVARISPAAAGGAAASHQRRIALGHRLAAIDVDSNHGHGESDVQRRSGSALHRPACGCPACTGATGARTQPPGAAPPVQRETSRCDNCGTFFDDDNEDQCPKCEGRNYDYPEEDAKYCTESNCPNYRRAVDTSSPHCPACKELGQTTRLESAEHFAALDAPAEDKSRSKSERKLKALMDKVENWISGSGSHHRSKGGRHTSGATAKHTSAHKSKKQVREGYATELEALIEAVDREDEASPLLKGARALVSQVLAK